MNKVTHHQRAQTCSHAETRSYTVNAQLDATKLETLILREGKENLPFHVRQGLFVERPRVYDHRNGETLFQITIPISSNATEPEWPLVEAVLRKIEKKIALCQDLIFISELIADE